MDPVILFDWFTNESMDAAPQATEWPQREMFLRLWRNPITGIAGCCDHAGPRRHRAAEQRDELAPLHSITSSARASSIGGTVTPSVLAVSALMTSSNLLACTTGRSAGFAPLRMRPAYTPT